MSVYRDRMPGSGSRLSAGSGWRDLSAESDHSLPMTLFTVSVVQVVLFVIESEPVLPGCVSHLLGVLHLFVRLGLTLI